MKLQCSCGAKYAFDITPEMVQNPVRFVCPQCGADSSDFVNELVRREFGAAAGSAVPLTIASAPAPAPVAASEPPPPAPPAGSRLRISHTEAPKPAQEEADTGSKYCPKHRGVLTTEKCAICGKPICPQCMELFGYFCSPLCKNKADMQGIAVPVYAGQKFNVEAKFWRKTGLIFGSCVAAVVGLVGLWTWYAWFGAVPHPYLAVRFETDPAYSGRVEVVDKSQVVFLHGGTLARYKMGSKTPVWTQQLVTQQMVDDAVKAEEAEQAKEAAADAGDVYRHTPMHDDTVREAKQALEGELNLHVSDHNIWVANGDKMTQYDWATGAPGKQVTLPEIGEDVTEANGELLVYGQQSVTHISLADGESHVDKIVRGPRTLASGGDTEGGGLPLNGADAGKPLDPQKVAAQAQNMKLQGKLALPALVANAQHEHQIEEALRDNPDLRHGHGDLGPKVGEEDSQVIPSDNGAVEFTTVLLEEKTISRSAMKAAPKKSALDGDVNAAHTGDIANELLNEMQRNNGGDTVEEDASRYKVTVHLPDSPDVADWSAEVTGAPAIFPLKTITVVTAGTSVTVLDKSNKKLWQATLTYKVSHGEADVMALVGMKPQYGDGPCVEHGDSLYIFDQAVLSAFELTTGNARWRLPTVGVVGLFFDDAGNLYINTTSGNPDDIKYSKQIDITKQTDDVVMKVDGKTGKTLWSIKPGGFISYVSGKFIYMTESNDPNPRDVPSMNDTMGLGLQKPAYFRVLRVNPRNGHTMFDYYQDRAPFFVHFDQNTITLVFKKEVQVLRYLTF